jgi:formate hydrogenlyase subunit 4
MATPWALLDLLVALALAPLLPGVVSRVKAIVAGRRGAPLFQLYFDLLKLARKGAVYSETTTWIFRAGPLVALAASASALLLVPCAGHGALVSFPVDFVLLVYLLALGRFFTVSAALDTGSSFEGMGASRDVQFAALAEPTLLLGFLTLARKTGQLSLASILGTASPLVPEVLLVAAAFAIVLLCETGRVPIDDPTTHLELTMIHEVMVLDHSGPDLALMQYAASLRLWLWSALVVALLAPPVLPGSWLAPTGARLGIFLVAVAVGLVESGMARARLVRVPHLLTAASALAALAFILVLR